MSRALFRAPAPEEVELALRRRQLSALRAVLAERELLLARLRDRLHSFEGRYIRQVGVLYRQLDEWETRIAELQVSRETMEETERLLREAGVVEPAEVAEVSGVESALDLKALFREVAKRIHPDFAVDDHDERQRTRLMAQANEAFRREDVGLLQRMLNGYDPATDSWSSEDAAAALARTLEQMDRVRVDTVAIDVEIETLGRSEMAELERRTIAAAGEGRDLLAELAARVKGSIGLAMRRFELDSIRARRGEARFDPSTLVTAEEPVSG